MEITKDNLHTAITALRCCAEQNRNQVTGTGDVIISALCREVADYLEKPIDGETSDGYHTFNELYYYRMLYNALWINALDSLDLAEMNVHKSKRHYDGELCFGGGWFIVSVTLPTGQVTNHYEMKYWDLFHCDEREVADEWDGHTPQEVACRMRKFLEL